ncbi:MAG: ATP-binding protein [Cyclobacteriaceae bacterium]|nr:ATP-binding protein [Cyclobacteriaceae bacterium]
MIHDRFSISIMIRVFLIVAASLLFAFLFARTDFLFSQVIVIIIILIQTIELIWFSRRKIRELTKFLMAVKYGDVTVNFHLDHLGKDFQSMSGAFRDLVRSFHEVKIDKEAQFQLLQIVIDRIGAGIIVYKEDGEILLMNLSAAELLRIGKVSRWASIGEYVPDFTADVESMAGSGRKLVELNDRGEQVQLSVVVHFLTIREEFCRLITFHDIRNEIEQKEIEAWYKLIRVLTHEIMNSVTPLGSLTDTILMLLEENGQQKPLALITEQQITDIRKSVLTIQKRSAGIMNFVEDYRRLTQIPHPEMEKIFVEEMFDRVTLLLRNMMEERKISVIKKVDPAELCIEADPDLMDQVLINLLTNAIYASKNSGLPVIELKAWEFEDGQQIEVADNGTGISPDKMNKIFIPFYSTREGGSGIGLSFSKHVIHLHKGRIKVHSVPGKGTSFILEFPKRLSG